MVIKHNQAKFVVIKYNQAMYCVDCNVVFDFKEFGSSCPQCANRCCITLNQFKNAILKNQEEKQDVPTEIKP